MPNDESVWSIWEENLKKHDEPFMTERDQPGFQQERDGLNDLFD